MERAYNLEPREFELQAQLDQEHQQALAQFGQLTLQLEDVRVRIPKIVEKKIDLVHQVAQRHGVTGYVAGRIVNRNLICVLPDEPPMKPTMDTPALPPSKANGSEVRE